MFLELDTDNLQQVVDKNDIVIVQFGASWCGNCRIIKPKFKQLSEEYADIVFVYADGEKFPKTRELTEIKALPTFVIFQNKQEVKKIVGTAIQKLKEGIDEITRN